MPRRSAGVLAYRTGPEVLLVHPGGPFWRGKDIGAWQIPKGEIEDGEEPEDTARREIAEELGVTITGVLIPLGEVRQAGGKLVTGFAAALNLDPAAIVSQTIEIDWPRGSGRRLTIPEIDAARWLTPAEARRVMLPSQMPFLDRLLDQVETIPATAAAPPPRAPRRASASR